MVETDHDPPAARGERQRSARWLAAHPATRRFICNNELLRQMVSCP